jgi:uncharacterized repeat protein (TIGR03803 family)
VFGTTLGGGAQNEGTVFKISPNGKETVLHSFTNCCGGDGTQPRAGLAADSSGNLYGTTSSGGLVAGTIFKLAPDGTEMTLYNFGQQQDGSDGVVPESKVTLDSSGNLYGTTLLGGTGHASTCLNADPCGVAYKLAPDGTYTVLYNFCSQPQCADGSNPDSGLIVDHQGNLYGTTTLGGNTPPQYCADLGCGTVFKIAPDGTETVLYRFCSQADCADGLRPQGDLIMDGAGNLYGTALAGGPRKRGILFRLAPDGTETVLYAFCQSKQCPDGFFPSGSLVLDGRGNLFGTTERGGGTQNRERFGVAYRLAPDGTETVLYNFCREANCADGQYPSAGLVADERGSFYGVASGGNGHGVVFALRRIGLSKGPQSLAHRTR